MLYWTSNQLPELRGVPADVREELVGAAVLSVPLTVRNLAVVLAFLVPVTSTGVLLTVFAWGGAFLLWLPLPVYGLNVLFLNMARPRIRELMQAGVVQEEGAERP